MSRSAQVALSWELRPGEGTLSQQLADQIRDAILSGTLTAGDRLPAVRNLAKDLGVARGTVATATELLIAEGLLETRAGSGTFVSVAAEHLEATPVTVATSGSFIENMPPEPDRSTCIGGCRFQTMSAIA